METRFLRTFLMVADTASLAETARRLNITPSAVVQRIKALEDEVGQTLIQRSGHAMRPTTAGAAVRIEAERLLLVEHDLVMAATAGLDTGLLRVGVIHTALTGLMPDLLTALGRDRPGIELYFMPGVSSDLYARVIEGTLDAAILVRPHFALPKARGWTPLRREPLVLITPAADSDRDARLVLQREPFIRYDRNNWGGRLVDLYLRKNKIRPREYCELDSLEAITILVSRGLGVSLVPDWLPPWPEGAEVRRVAVARSPIREIGMLWLKASKRSPLIHAFQQEVLSISRAQASDPPADHR